MSTGDFKGKQFKETEVADKVVEQYDLAHARIFYKYVMGGGGMDIHYGAFRSASDGVFESSKETNKRLLTTLDWMRPITEKSLVLDLGSGHGGLSHELIKTYGCKVIGVNISPEQNKMNEEEAKRLGVGDKNEVVLANFNDGLPADWTGKFTHVVSCEVFCHAASKPGLLADLKRCLAPGGALAFTDIMGADGANEKALKDFTDRNATTEMARPSNYRQMLKDVGYREVSFLDMSAHLVLYFDNMVKQINTHKADMMKEGVSEEYLAKWLDSLTQRVDIQREHEVFAWG
eukprot:CAMPEP_0206024228 /NCGR_PEP_ID=MMETSP1464-20131121/37838_1 /ASSEMBLY_ACC=CAM_ASM_001124 /TAXON_ID=119497 /ORGANISM="Exanthemachrysis gayraliae, Strain RCC1523" /LENGTH=288 /DNA_ID=CAMNT_0053398231 /DNA_START=70 /DNA_END=932 /DNA_ORIENTATION=+